jgi:ATP-binding cassette subfamily B protein
VNVQEKISLNNSFFRFWRHLGPHRRHQFILLLVLMIVASFAEVVSIGTVIPFLGALTNPEIIFSNQMMQPFINYLGINTPSQVVVPLTLVFCFFALLSGVIRLILLKFSNHFSFATGADLSLSIYKKTLYQPYKVHISRNTSEIINGISSKSNSIIYNVILPSLTIISSSIMLINPAKL